MGLKIKLYFCFHYLRINWIESENSIIILLDDKSICIYRYYLAAYILYCCFGSCVIDHFIVAITYSCSSTRVGVRDKMISSCICWHNNSRKILLFMYLIVFVGYANRSCDILLLIYCHICFCNLS